MMSFCVAPGAAFVVTFLGCGVLGSLRLGWLLFASVTLSGLILGVLAGLGKPMPEKQPSSPVSPGQQLPLGAIGVGRLFGCGKNVRLHFAVCRVHSHPPGQRDFPNRSPEPFCHRAVRPPGNCRLPVLPAGGHRRDRGRSRIGGGPCFLRFRGGLWRAVRPLAGVFLFPGIPPVQKVVLPHPVPPWAGGRRDLSGAAAHLPRGSPMGIGVLQRALRTGHHCLHRGGRTFPAADVPGIPGICGTLPDKRQEGTLCPSCTIQKDVV